MKSTFTYTSRSLLLRTLSALLALGLFTLSYAGVAAAISKQELVRSLAEGAAEVDLIPVIRDSEPMGLTPEDLAELRRVGASERLIEYLHQRGHVGAQEHEDESRSIDLAEPGAEAEEGAQRPVQQQPVGEQSEPQPSEEPTRAPAASETPSETQTEGKRLPSGETVAREATDQEALNELRARSSKEQEEEKKPPIPVGDPLVFDAPTGRLIPEGVIYSNLGIDTGGGVGGSSRIGLGDVAEFGLDFTDHVRFQREGSPESDSIVGFPFAIFRLGVNESRLWAWQPGMVLGFRKSFQITHLGRESQLAELSLVFTRSFGDLMTVHAGGQLWDGEVRFHDPETGDENRLLLHEGGVSDQLRGFGALELKPLEHSTLLFELYYVPEFTYANTFAAHDIDLNPVFSWGVRNKFAPWMQVEAGVKLPNIGEANLINAEIFGQVTFIVRAINDLLN